MATIGQVINTPEAGWKRYDDSHDAFMYTGKWSTRGNSSYYKSSQHTISPTVLDAKVTFKFYGTKIRLATSIYPTYTDKARIVIDGVGEDFSLAIANIGANALVYEKTNLPLGYHTVEVFKTASGTYNPDFIFDVVDIDDNGFLLHPHEVLSLDELTIGKRIRAHYVAPSENGVVGTYSSFGKDMYVAGDKTDFIPVESTATPNGQMYFICVDKDHLGQWKLIADRNVQHTISWNDLNKQGLVTGLEDITSQIFKTPMALRSGASSAFWAAPKDGEPWFIKFRANIRGGYYLLSSGSQTSSLGMHISYQGGSKTVGLRTATRYYNIDSVTMKMNEWAEYMFVYTGSSLEWYVNGVLDKTAAPTQIGAMSASGSLTILRPSNTTSYAGDADIVNLEFHMGTLDNPFDTVETIALNNVTKYGVNYDNENFKYVLRLLTGGVSATDKNNEWNKYIVESDLGGLITPGDKEFWNIGKRFTSVDPVHWTSTTPTNAGNRTTRGRTTTDGFWEENAATALSYTVFRPVLFVSAKGIQPRYFVKDNDEYKVLRDGEWVTIPLELTNYAQIRLEGMIDVAAITNEALQKLVSDTPTLECFATENVDKKTLIQILGGSAWMELGPAPATPEMFNQYGVKDIGLMTPVLDELTSDTPKLLTTDIEVENKTMRITGVPHDVLIVPVTDISLTNVYSIDYFNLKAGISNQLLFKVIASFDEGVTWYTRDGNTWAPIALTLEEVKSNGMTAAVFNSLGRFDWEEIRKGSDTVRFAYFMSMNKSTDSVAIDALVSQVDMQGRWKHAKTATWEYITNDFLNVILTKNGDYKIIY